ncbi:MAG: response regulator [Candidatus Krumholzibacteriota bacterium]|nr:response regulator [Candidatus Krumholzibacteriota bacterium]
MARLLIVDDDEQNLYMLQVLLSANGFQVDQASNGKKALEQARLNPPDMIVSDILMPVMDGYALCREWKRDEKLKEIPFIFYTATYTDPKDEELALNLGADRFIIKPTGPDKFLAILLEILENFETKKPVANKQVMEESVFYKNYNTALIRKLEEKMLEVEESNRSLEQELIERKRLEKERLNYKEQMIQAQKMESVGRLAGGIAHDFNNILGVILGYSELALLQLDPGDQLYADIREIQEAAHRSADLTRQLLAFARRQPVRRKVIDMNETMTGMLKMLQRLIGEDTGLVWIPGEGLWQVKMDPGQIDQILANLCINARDAIDGAGEVVISTSNVVIDADSGDSSPDLQPGEYVRLMVQDSGSGMDDETLSHLFEPFFTTKEIGKGTGLGLSTVYGIVKQNNGDITVASKPGAGTKFEIYFPRFISLKGEEINDISRTSSLHGEETVLLVEDEPRLLKLTRKMLESLGYEVLTAFTPEEALQVIDARVSTVDLLITDLVMPEMNGVELAKLVEKRHPGVSVLFMSGHSADMAGADGILEEDREFIQKPFSVNNLAVKLRDILDQKQVEKQ